MKRDFSILKETISPDNVLVMSELIAIIEIRFQIGYMGTRIEKMYANLFEDINNRNNPKHTLSDSYDLVQEGALYLCGYFGKHLHDVIGYSKRGKPITIEIMCMRKMMRLLNRKSTDCCRFVSLDSLTPANEPSYEMQEEIEEDYTQYDKIIESLNLTENMRIALECRMNGLSYPEIGRILERAHSTVFEYFIKMRQRYTAIYS